MRILVICAHQTHEGLLLLGLGATPIRHEHVAEDRLGRQSVLVVHQTTACICRVSLLVCQLAAVVLLPTEVASSVARGGVAGHDVISLSRSCFHQSGRCLARGVLLLILATL